MTNRLFIYVLCVLCGQLVQGATYYVATTGSDSAAGSQAAPFATAAKASTVAQPGDLVLVQPGIFSERNVISGGGTTNAHVVYRANGAVTNRGQWVIEASNVTIDGFEVTGGGSWQNGADSIYIGRNRTNVWVINNYFHDTPGGWDTAVSANELGWAYSCVASNNVVHNWGAANDAVFCPRGWDWVVCNNVISNSYGGDAIRLYGGRHTVRANVVKDLGSAMVMVYGAANPAMNGMYYYNSTLTALYDPVDVGGILATYIHTNANGYAYCNFVDEKPTVAPGFADYGWSNKVCIFAPDRSITYASAPTCISPAAEWTMHNALIGSVPSGTVGYVNHPDFVQIFGSTVSTNHLIEANYIEGNTVSAISQLACQTLSGYPTNLPINDWTFRNNIFVNLRSATCSIRTKWYNNLFYKCGGTASAIAMSTYSTYSGDYRGSATGSEVKNNIFIEGAGGAYNSGWYAYTHNDTNQVSDVIKNCDYNYVTRSATTWEKVRTSGTSTYYAFYEPHGINGGNPQFVNVGALNFHLLANSFLIDKGTNILSSDQDGWPRPQGVVSDIGPYEFDPSLQVHLDFDQGFANTNVVVDVTGYGHNAWQGNTTSHIAAVAGPKGGTAGRWHQIGTMTNAPPNTYVLSQYLVITNLSGIEFITNGTVSLWVQWAKYTNDASGATRHATLLDSGGTTLQFANPPSLATNSWRLVYGPASSTLPAVGPVLSAYSESANWPSNFVQFTHARDESTWHHITMTWEANGNAIGYENGVPFVTNAFPRPFLRVAGRNPLSPPFQATDAIPWIAVGAASHGGSLTWGDDRYPNDGYFVGKMDDIRIYNRPLASAEVATLYTGSTATSSTPPEVPTPVPPVIIAQSESLTVNALSSLTLFVTATGTTPLTYQWRKGGIPSATDPIYSISEVLPAHAGTYSCTVSNIAGTATTADIVLVVIPNSPQNLGILQGIGLIEGTGTF